MIVMVSTLGDVWLSPEEATAVAKAMKNNVTSMTLRGSIYTTRSVQGLLQPEAYKTMYVTKRRSWTCQKGAGHAWNDNCTCATQLKMSNAPQLAAAHELSPEEELEAQRRLAANLAWLNSIKHDWSLGKDTKKREAFIKDFKLPVDKTIAKP